MKCEQAKDLFSPYIDNMVKPQEEKALEAHLLSCQSCAHELDQIKNMCNILSKLEAPPLPEHLAQTIHERLVLEKPLSNWRFVEIKKPLNPGWLAAGLAGLALAAGIYVSSFIPAANIASLWNNRDVPPKSVNEEKVDDILSRVQQTVPNDNTSDLTAPVDMAKSNNNDATGEVTNPLPVTEFNSAESIQQESQEQQISILPEVQVEPKKITTYRTQITVANISDSLQQMDSIVNAAGADASIAFDGVQAMSKGVTHEINIKISKDKAQSLLTQLESLGAVASSPVEEQVELTDRYKDIINEINDINVQMEAADDDDLTKLLNAQLEELNREKEQIDKDLNLVQIKLYLVEEITP